MRTRVSVSDSWLTHGSDVEIVAETGAEVAAVLEAVRSATGLHGAVEGVDGRIEEVGPWDNVADLLPGNRLVITNSASGRAPATSRSHGPSTGWILRVAEGPGAGQALPIGLSTVLGRSKDADIRLDDAELSRRHMEFRVRGSVVEIRDLGSSNGTLVDDAAIAGDWVPVPPGATIEAGMSFLNVERQRGTSAPVMPRDLRLELVESARPVPPRPAPLRLQWPPTPAQERRARIPWVVFLAPLVFAIVVATWRGTPDALIFAVLTPISLLGNWWYQRGESRGRSSEDGRRYERTVQKIRDDVSEATAAERDRLLALYPGPVESIDIGLRHLTRLWERRRDHEDFASLRLGLSRRDSAVQIAYPAEEPGEQPVLMDAPITVDLHAGTVLGISGTGEAAEGLGRWLATQLAVSHSPDVLLIAVLGVALDGKRWGSMRWLPHVSRQWLLGHDGESSAAIADRLSTPADDAVLHASVAPGGPRPPRAVVLLTDAADLRRLPAVARLLSRAAELDIAVMCLADEPRRLPPECRTVIHVEGDLASMTGNSVAAEFRPETVTLADLDAVCRALAPVVAPSPAGAADRILPDLVRLQDLLRGPTTEAGAMRDRWANRSAKGVIARTAQGPFVLDLAEQGPHALVAGTTGSGKSEFLRTAVTSLAANADPETVNFVFVDYKGDSAFRVLKQLPHCVGFVTDLDERGAERALVSFKAEVQRRKELITVAARCDDIDTYGTYRRRHPQAGLPPLPRLVIMVDEFAQLKQNMPDFIAGLVDIAQVGRSLGMHLVLATQRPAGNISDQIRACVDLVVCLRTATDSESRDVIGTSEAAHLPKASRGRALIRIAGAPPIVAQTASSTWTASVADASVHADKVAWFAEAPPAAEADAAPVDQLDVAEVGGEEPEAVRVVRLAQHVWTEAGGLAMHRPWLEPVPALLPVAALEAATGDVELRLGLLDQPQRQAQSLLVWPLASGHLSVVGGLRSGRTTALRTYVADLADRTSPDDVHVHVIDGGGQLEALAGLPQVGVVVQRGQAERLSRLLDLLEREVATRGSRYASGNLGSLAHQRMAAAAADPYLLLVIDRWDSFADADPRAELTPRLARLLSDGAEVGLVALMTGDERFGASAALAQRMQALLALRVSDPTAALVPGLSPKQLSATATAGRAVWSVSGQEMQIPVLSSDGTAPAENRAVAAIGTAAAARLAASPALSAPARIDALPDEVSLQVALGLPAVGTGHVLCVGGNTLSGFRWDCSGPRPVVHLIGRAPVSYDVAGLVAQQVMAAGGRAWWRGPGGPSGTSPVEMPGSLEPIHAEAESGDLLVCTSLDGLDSTDLVAVAGVRGLGLIVVTTPGQIAPPALAAVSSMIGTVLALGPMTKYDFPNDVATGLDPTFRLEGPVGRGLLITNRQRTLVQVPLA